MHPEDGTKCYWKRVFRPIAVSVNMSCKTCQNYWCWVMELGGCNVMLLMLAMTAEDWETQACFPQYSIKCSQILQKVQKWEWSYLELDRREPKRSKHSFWRVADMRLDAKGGSRDDVAKIGLQGQDQKTCKCYLLYKLLENFFNWRQNRNLFQLFLIFTKVWALHA